MATISIVSNSYAPFGETPGEPTHPEPVRVPRKTIRYRDILARFGWNDDQFAYAKRVGFPDPAGRRMTQYGAADDGHLFWYLDAIEAWQKELTAFVQAL